MSEQDLFKDIFGSYHDDLTSDSSSAFSESSKSSADSHAFKPDDTEDVYKSLFSDTHADADDASLMSSKSDELFGLDASGKTGGGFEFESKYDQPETSLDFGKSSSELENSFKFESKYDQPETSLDFGKSSSELENSFKLESKYDQPEMSFDFGNTSSELEDSFKFESKYDQPETSSDIVNTSSELENSFKFESKYEHPETSPDAGMPKIEMPAPLSSGGFKLEQKAFVIETPKFELHSGGLSDVTKQETTDAPAVAQAVETDADVVPPSPRTMPVIPKMPPSHGAAGGIRNDDSSIRENRLSAGAVPDKMMVSSEIRYDSSQYSSAVDSHFISSESSRPANGGSRIVSAPEPQPEPDSFYDRKTDPNLKPVGDPDEDDAAFDNAFYDDDEDSAFEEAAGAWLRSSPPQPKSDGSLVAVINPSEIQIRAEYTTMDLLRKYDKMGTIGGILLVIAIIAFFPAVGFEAGFMIFLTIAALITAICLIVHASSKQTEIFKGNVVTPVLTRVLNYSVATSSLFKSYAESYVAQVLRDLVINNRWESMSLSDAVIGNLYGRNFAFLDLKLTHSTGGRNSRTITDFAGQVLAMPLRLRISEGFKVPGFETNPGIGFSQLNMQPIRGFQMSSSFNVFTQYLLGCKAQKSEQPVYSTDDPIERLSNTAKFQRAMTELAECARCPHAVYAVGNLLFVVLSSNRDLLEFQSSDVGSDNISLNEAKVRVVNEANWMRSIVIPFIRYHVV